KIVFYEDKDFKGKSYDCKGDSVDLQSYIRRCNSLKVEGGWWVLYERSNFTGYQYVIGPGDYNAYHKWMGFNDCVRSCRIIKIRLFNRPNFGGQSIEVTDNMKSVPEQWQRNEVLSCKVLVGPWVFYEHPNFSGRQYLLEKGDYRHHTEWGALRSTVGSIKRVTQ
uniref:Crystallin, gamma S4 n=1 Tax=Neogobius melanostomus TaxID=47308 RepID=A0A8C6TH58_9GOBI